MDVEQTIPLVSGVVATLATLIAGTWAFYRFRKSRTFKPRLTLGAEAELSASNAGNKLLCTFKVKNVGHAKVNIDKAHVRLGILSGKDEFIHLTTLAILKNHSWVEPGATLTEQEIISCNEYDKAIKIVFRLEAGGTTFWTNRVVQITEVSLREFFAGEASL